MQSSAEAKVREWCGGLQADRQTDRKKACESLKEAIRSEGSAAVAALSRADANPSWKHLFDATQQFVLKEGEKGDKGRCSANMENLCSPLLFAVVIGANKAGRYLSCEKIVDYTSEVLKCPKLTCLVGNTYVTLLIKHVLCVKHYLEQLNPIQWAELLDLSVELCSKRKTDIFNTLRLSATVMKEGSKRCHLILPIRDNLNQIANLFTSNDFTKKDNTQETLLEILITITENISSECRWSVCIFTESVLPYVLKFYDKTTSSYETKKKYLFQFLNLTVLLHHPGGRAGNKPGCLAGDWDAWNNLLSSIHQLVVAEATRINENLRKKLNSDIPQDSDLFLQYINLAADVCHQVFVGLIQCNATDENVIKRPKKDRHNYLSLMPIIESLLSNFYPWINIIEAYVYKYIDYISDDDRIKILNSLILLSENKDLKFSQNNLYNVIFALIAKINKENLDSQYEAILLKIWNAVLRNGSVNCNLSLICHKIIQCLLNMDMFSPNIESLLKFYLDKTMPFCSGSLITLDVLLSKHNIMITDTKHRIQIVQWILNNCSSLSSDLNFYVASILFKLCVKENILTIKKYSNFKTQDLFADVFENQEHLMLINDFEFGLLIENDTKPDDTIKKTAISTFVEVYDFILDALNAQISTNIDEAQTSKNISKEALSTIDVFFQIISYLLDYNLINLLNDINHTKLQMIKFLETMNNFFPISFKKLSDDKEKSLELLSRLKLLYLSEFYSNSILIFIRERTSKVIIEFICNLLNCEDDDCVNEMDIFNLVETTTDNPYKALAIEILLCYNLKDSQFTTETMELLLDFDLYNMESKSEFNIAVKVISFTLNNFTDSIPIDGVFSLMQKMCKAFFRDNDASFTILCLFHELLKPISINGTSTTKDNCIIMLSGYLKRCTNHYYSPKTMGQVLKCLSWIFIHSNLKDWGKSLRDVFLKGISSNIHSIRIYLTYLISQYIAKVYTENFESIVDLLLDLFTIDATDLTSNVMVDEGANRTATVLHFLAAIMVTSPVWDRTSLTAMFNVAHEKNINKDLLRKVVSLVANSFNMPIEKLISENMTFIINSMYLSNKSVDAFPWFLINSKSIEHFYCLHKNIIIPIEWYHVRNETERKIFDLVVNNNNVSPSVLINECLPNLLVLCLSNASYEFKGFNSNNLKSLLQRQFGDCKHFPEEDALRRLFTTEIDKILSGILNFVWDEESIFEDVGWEGYLPYVNKPTLSKSEFYGILKFLDDIYQVELIMLLCTNNPKKIQQLLLQIWSEIELNKSLESKLLRLHRYWIFCQILPLESPLKEFLCHFIIHSLIYLIDNYKNCKRFQLLSIAACKVFHSFLCKILPNMSNTTAHLVPKIVSILVNIALENQPTHKQCIITLKLIYNKREKFFDILKMLDPLPNVSIFSDIKSDFIDSNDSIDHHIANFLNGGPIGRFEGLKILHKKMVEQKIELKQLFKNLEDIRGLSEDCKSSKMHRLICLLLEIAYNQEEKSSLEACRCLGEIGPSNLQTLMVRLPDNLDAIIESPIQCFVYTVLINTRDILFHESYLNIEAVAIALISILSFDIGMETLGLINKKKEYSNILDLFLPFSKKAVKKPSVKISAPLFDGFVDRPEIWYDFNKKKHSEWVIDIVVSILKCFSTENSFLPNLINVFQLNISLAEKCFQPLVGLLISLGNKRQLNVINQHIQSYFNRYRKATFIFDKLDSFDNDHCSDYDVVKVQKIQRDYEKQSVDCMLQLVQFIRLQMKYYKWYNDDEELFSFDYLPIAWAAYLNSSYFMAILFCELWCIDMMDQVPTSDPEAIEDIINGEDMLLIMRMSYQSIGDADAMNGCGSAHFSKPDGKRNHYMFKRSYFDAMLLHDISLSSIGNQLNIDEPHNSNKKISMKSFARCLNNSGLYYLTEKFIRSSQSLESFDNEKFDCYWRLGDWSVEFDLSSLNSTRTDQNQYDSLDSNDLWSAHHYLSLKYALDRKLEAMDYKLSETLNESRKYILSTTKSVESCQGIYKLTSRLQILQEIEKYIITISDEKASTMPFSNLFENWSTKNLLPFNDFKNIEPILSQRVVIFDNISKNSSLDVQLSISQLVLEYAELALIHGWTHSCNRWISLANQICQKIHERYECSSKVKQLNGFIQLTEGKVAWQEGHPEVALHLVKAIISDKNKTEGNLYAKALMQYGSWMIRTRRENPQQILNNYFTQSLDTLEDDVDLPAKLDAYFAIARFADEEYKQIDTYLKSPTFLNKMKFMEKCNETYHLLKNKPSNTLSKDERKAMIFSEQQRNIDEIEIQNNKDEKQQYLQLAMRFYLQSLLDGEEHNLCIFRFVSLWLDNPDVELNENTKKSLKDFLRSIPSRKFILVIPQLAPRMNFNEANTFQDCLTGIMEKCATEHPHHTLPILLALKYSYKDNEYKIETESQVKNRNRENTENNEYVISAEKILNSILGRKNNRLISIIQEMERLSLAMIKFAYYSIEKNKVSKMNTHPIPRSEPIRSLKKLHNILIPTVTLPINHRCNYNNIPTIESFSDNFVLVGGINAPKKLSCKGSDGIDRHILIKGGDDFRQDAVMQQVFGIVNQLLNNDRHTKQRRLVIRTYKIVVLSRFSGIIEWCNGTEPLGVLLTGPSGSTGYHAKYRPNDMPATEARRLLGSKRKATNKEKFDLFNNILSKFKPVFHFFFIENFLTPVIWYERRLAYIHSVATSSMAGYILGIGDRHVQNILIDKSTAEVIHIDFGIAFEQGRLQPTPETVPFRLTQDMVAGLGCTGIEGVFRKSCEKTMEVLKANRETLLTILEVLLCDPLYIWTLSQREAFKKQDLLIPDLPIPLTCNVPGGSNEKTVSEAERALSRVRSKLEGNEFGSTLATSGQVTRLLQQATDPNNLSRLFCGWQPHL